MLQAFTLETICYMCVIYFLTVILEFSFAGHFSKASFFVSLFKFMLMVHVGMFDASQERQRTLGGLVSDSC